MSTNTPERPRTKRTRSSPTGKTPRQAEKRPVRPSSAVTKGKLTYGSQSSGSSRPALYTPPANWTDDEDKQLTQFVLLNSLRDKWPTLKSKKSQADLQRLSRSSATSTKRFGRNFNLNEEFCKKKCEWHVLPGVKVQICENCIYFSYLTMTCRTSSGDFPANVKKTTLLSEMEYKSIVCLIFISIALPITIHGIDISFGCPDKQADRCGEVRLECWVRDSVCTSDTLRPVLFSWYSGDASLNRSFNNITDCRELPGEEGLHPYSELNLTIDEEVLQKLVFVQCKVEKRSIIAFSKACLIRDFVCADQLPSISPTNTNTATPVYNHSTASFCACPSPTALPVKSPLHVSVSGCSAGNVFTSVPASTISSSLQPSPTSCSAATHSRLSSLLLLLIIGQSLWFITEFYI